MVVLVGKTYIIQLIPPGIYDPIVYPDGLILLLVISPAVVLSVIMLIVLVRDFIINRININIFGKVNFLLLIFQYHIQIPYYINTYFIPI